MTEGVKPRDLLTTEDLKELTGRERPKKQKDRLQKIGVAYFDLSESEYPRTTWAAVNDALVTNSFHTNAAEPNYGGI